MSKAAVEATTDRAVRVKRDTAKLSAEKVHDILADPKKATKWLKWIKKLSHVQADVYEAETVDGKFQLAWWFRSDAGELVLRFKYGFYAAEARYIISAGNGSRLIAEFPMPPAGWPFDEDEVRKRLEAELAALEKLAK